MDRRGCAPQGRVVLPLGLLGVGLLLSALWAMVGTSLAIWNLTDADQRATISGIQRVLLIVVVLANLAPFVAAAVSLLWARARGGSSWPRALQLAAGWTGAACAASFVCTMIAAGGL